MMETAQEKMTKREPRNDQIIQKEEGAERKVVQKNIFFLAFYAHSYQIPLVKEFRRISMLFCFQTMQPLPPCNLWNNRNKILVLLP